MYALLKDMRVVEATSFIASPTAGLYLLQMGAEVIRFDQIGGGPDFNRWPKADNGASLYWEGLNKGKKSIAIDLGRPEGRDLAAQLATAPGERGGLFLTNYPVNGFLSHERLTSRRPDLITVRVMGQANGGPALDYTVNSAVGVPYLTGPSSMGDEPVNNVLPAWDLVTGAYAAFALLAAERWRRDGGQGQEVRVPLTDVGIATMGNLGMIAEVLSTGYNRQRYGNEVYGAFGRDFLTADGKRLMVMAMTPRQWRGLVRALDIADAVSLIEAERGVSFDRDEGVRFEHRDALTPLVESGVARYPAAELEPLLDSLGCCWGAYQTMREAAADPELVVENPIFSEIVEKSGLSYPVPGAMATLPQQARQRPVRAPHLGEHTDQVLAEVLGLSTGAIGALHDQGLVAQA
jgi:2-methylfumaryl-CoA isomerase